MSASPLIEKCVVLARGLGTRMRQDDPGARLDASQSAVAELGAKAMIPVGRPFLDYVLSAAADAGLRRICLVIGPEHSFIQDYYRRLQPGRVEISFAVQPDPLGTANAVSPAEQFAGQDEFGVLNGDNYYPAEALRQVQALGQPGAVLFDAAALVACGNIPEDRIGAFASCVVDADGFLADIVEKANVVPAEHTKLVSMNCWRFGPEIFAACRDVQLSPRGEYELPSAAKLALQRGHKLKVAISQTGVLDLSRRSDIAGVTERLKNVRVEL
ncbi:MAG: sugar phosphate nucleotidyltransferase [Candidatus Korobacteraceae bacterium]